MKKSFQHLTNTNHFSAAGAHEIVGSLPSTGQMERGLIRSQLAKVSNLGLAIVQGLTRSKSFLFLWTTLFLSTLNTSIISHWHSRFYPNWALFLAWCLSLDLSCQPLTHNVATAQLQAWASLTWMAEILPDGFQSLTSNSHSALLPGK